MKNELRSLGRKRALGKRTALESSLETHYRHAVMRAGGKTRKLTGEIHDPDQLTIWPGRPADVHFIELKRPGEKPRPGQVRKIARLNSWGCFALYLDTKEAIDLYVRIWGKNDQVLSAV